MKTLSEVIDALEICSQIDAECCKCPYKSTAKGWCEEKDRDALHYLKEYQGYLIGKEISEAFDEAFTEMYNPPLTWDELKKMKGKPVWIESNCFKSEWYILADFNAFEPEEVKQKLYGIDKVCFCMELEKDSCGTQWQAYRKERE